MRIPVPGARSRDRSASAGVEQVADDDELPFAGIHARHDLGMEPSVRLVAVLLRAHPFAVLRVVHDDELRPVLKMPEAADLLAARSRKDAHAVREDNVLLLPLLALALEREVLDDSALDLAVILLDELARLELMLDGGNAGASPGARNVGDKDDERVFFGVIERKPASGSAKLPNVLLPEPRKPRIRTRRSSSLSSAWISCGWKRAGGSVK